MNANVLDHPALEVGGAQDRVANISVALREGPCLPLETPTKPKGLGEGMWERKRWKKRDNNNYYYKKKRWKPTIIKRKKRRETEQIRIEKKRCDHFEQRRN